VSFWFSYQDAAAFPQFWIKRILNVLEQIGPSGGPVDIVAGDFNQTTEKVHVADIPRGVTGGESEIL
jgi:hypothetical protein